MEKLDGAARQSECFEFSYQKYSLGLLCIGSYSKSLRVQCNRPIRMEFVAHTFRCHLEYCQGDK